jgi:ribosomal protein S18 acetylase RimI-like enzyme
MLHAATPAEIDFIRRVLAEGAADGSFDPELAGNSPSASLFYANLGEALRSGYLRVPDANGELTREVHVAGYVYATQKGERRVGFGLFKALGDVGFELWLTGISADSRGHGHGRAMLAELLATPAGQMTWLIRCNRKSTSLDVAMRLFQASGFALCRTTPGVHWLVSSKAPQDLATRIANAPLGEG